MAEPSCKFTTKAKTAQKPISRRCVADIIVFLFLKQSLKTNGVQVTVFKGFMLQTEYSLDLEMSIFS
jgi:hypothetical protein